MDEISSSAINQVNKSSPVEAIIFSNLMCPHCGNTLKLYHTIIRGNNLPIRYECGSCKYVCPIYHDTENNKMLPSYDQGIHDFLSNFGENFRNRISHLERDII